MEIQDKVSNSFLRTYLDYIEDTETPRIMMIWSIISGVGACLGRRAHLSWGFKDIYANEFVLLVGPPGARKSTAALIMKKRLTKATGIRFAPDDTAGQRKGLIVAIEDTPNEDPDLQKATDANGHFDVENIDALLNARLSLDPRDQHVLYAVASEFSNFIGTNAREMIKFLIKMYDGEDYGYRLSDEKRNIKEGLLSFIGCTTPTSIAEDLPPGSVGQGFTSRILFVYAAKRYKKVPKPPKFPKDLEAVIEKRLKTLYYDFDGEMDLSPEADKLAEVLYDYDVQITDSRFLHYAQRRQDHLLKTSMCLAAAELRKQVEVRDIEEAHMLLVETEIHMPDALGEFGLSPFALAQQNLLEIIEHAQQAVGEETLRVASRRDFRNNVDFKNALMTLQQADKILQVNLKSGGTAYIHKDRMLPTEVVDILAEAEQRRA